MKSERGRSIQRPVIVQHSNQNNRPFPKLRGNGGSGILNPESMSVSSDQRHESGENLHVRKRNKVVLVRDRQKRRVVTLYTLIQNGDSLTGKLEAPAAGFGPGGGASGGPIEGSVDGKNISFRVGTTTYTGTLSGDQITLRKTSAPWPGPGSASPIETGPRPAIGPLPDGSDPSLGGFPGRGTQPPILLRRASR
jgi:hypothetical protein